jgi:hypothetical protein
LKTDLEIFPPEYYSGKTHMPVRELKVMSTKLNPLFKINI